MTRIRAHAHANAHTQSQPNRRHMQISTLMQTRGELTQACMCRLHTLASLCVRVANASIAIELQNCKRTVNRACRSFLKRRSPFLRASYPDGLATAAVAVIKSVLAVLVRRSVLPVPLTGPVSLTGDVPFRNLSVRRH